MARSDGGTQQRCDKGRRVTMGGRDRTEARGEGGRMVRGRCVASEQHDKGDMSRMKKREKSGQQMEQKRKERKNEPSVL